MSNNLGLTKEEDKKIKIICEFLFFDQFTEIATFLRFEKCFQPLFSEEPDLDFDILFKELCGQNKKYLNYKRFVAAYLKYKEGKSSKQMNLFFGKLFNSILQKKSIGSLEEGRFTYSTIRSNKNRESITLIEVLNDNEGVIHGINIEYDGIFKNKLYPIKLEDNLYVGLEISLKILDEEKLEKIGISKYMKDSYFRDSITHIFGTKNEETGYITFLGFKCISGKTQFIGFPKGKSFLIGKFGKKFKQLKCQMTSDGITTLIPYFEENHRPNVYLSTKISKLTLNDLYKDEIILDEAYLPKIKDKNDIDKFISTTFIDEAHCFNNISQDNISGNSLIEVIKKKPKSWMIKNMENQRKRTQKLLPLNSFMEKFEEEQKRRGSFFRSGEINYPEIDSGFHKMHTRKRLKRLGFEYKGFYYDGRFFRGFQRHLSSFGSHGVRFVPFDPMSSFKRAFSTPLPLHYFSSLLDVSPPGPHGGFGYFEPPQMEPYPSTKGNNLNDFGCQNRYENYYNNFCDNIAFRGKKNLKSEDEIENEKIHILDENDDEEILIPDEHPENTTSLEELDEELTSIKNLLEKKELKKEEKNKLLKLEKLYSLQKNILLDNIENKEKEELLKKNDINIDEYIKQVQEKRLKESEKTEKIIHKESKENFDETESEIISIITKPDPKKTFLNQEMYKGQEPWIDPLFKPCKENLCPCNEKGWLLPENVFFIDVYGWEQFDWCRVEEILNSKNYQVFEDGISPDDIIQGSLGDCYFLSAIGALCKFSHYIDKLFFTKEKTKEHLYGVYLYLNGVWKLVFVDDFLPYSGKKFKKFAFSSSGGNELWVALLEKAWAKINGNYAKIGCGGYPTEVFDILTEAYSEQIPINPYYKDYIWETMYDSEKRGYIMTAGSSIDIFNLNLDEVGLLPGHSYSVLGVLEIDTGKELEKVVRLRNTYGNGEFNGDWSDYSSKWTTELKEKYKLVKKDDGDFYMAFNDFINYYVTLGICKLHQGYKTTSIRIKHPTKCQVIRIIVRKGEVHAYLQLYQKNPRIILKDGTYQKLVFSYLLLVDENFNYIYSIYNAKPHIGIEQTLKKGTYYLISDVNYRYDNADKKNHSYMITCYSQKPLYLENVTDQMDTTYLLKTVIYSYCRQYIPPVKCSNGVYLYRTSTNMDSLPFETAVFENYTNKNYKVKVNVVGKGQKSFCFYDDEIASENDISVTKELPINSLTIFSVLRYSLSSIFILKYFFAPLKVPSGNILTYQKIPKILAGKQTLQPEQPVDQNYLQTDAQYQYIPQNQDIQNIPQYNPQQELNTQKKQFNIQGQYIQNNIQNLNNQESNMINTNKQFIPYQNQVKDFRNNKMQINYNNQVQNNLNNPNTHIKMKTDMNILDKQNSPQKNTNVNRYMHNKNLSYHPYNKNNVNNQNNKNGNPVFKTQGQIINEEGTLIQYKMINGDNYIIGLENRSNLKIRLELILKGLVINSTGKSNAIFYSNPKERKIFNTKILPNYNYQQISFKFNYS